MMSFTVFPQCQVGQSNIWASQKYSQLVRMILEDSIENSDYDYHFPQTITEMRSIISYNNASREPSWQEGQWWFDNMTIYIDILRDIQRQMAEVGIMASSTEQLPPVMTPPPPHHTPIGSRGTYARSPISGIGDHWQLQKNTPFPVISWEIFPSYAPKILPFPRK